MDFFCCCVLGDKKASHLQHVPVCGILNLKKKQKKHTLYISSSEVILLVLNFIWKKIPVPNQTPSLLKIWPQLRVKCGLDSLKKTKVLPSAFVSAHRQLCLVLHHSVWFYAA